MAEPTQVPIDKFGELAYQAQLKGVALARYIQALGASFVITLHADTKFVELYAIAQDIYLHWAESNTDYCTGANLDEVVIAGSKQIFPVPTKEDGTPFTKITLVGRVAGSTAVVIER